MGHVRIAGEAAVNLCGLLANKAEHAEQIDKRDLIQENKKTFTVGSA